MSKAHDAGYLPFVVLVGPDHDEVGDAFAISTLELAEAVGTELDRTVILDRVDPQAARHQFAAEVAADISGGVRQHVLAGPGDAALVVIELDVRREEAGVELELGR